MDKIFCKWFWKDFYYKQISSRINPRQKWLIKKIPRTYCDKVELIRILLYECIIQFVEKDGEDCFNVVDWEWNKDVKDEGDKIKEIYNWIKIERPLKEKEMWASYPEADIFNLNKNKKSYEEKYGRVNELEKYIEDKDEKYLIEIVKLRRCLWT
jgi:hypothetical protein